MLSLITNFFEVVNKVSIFFALAFLLLLSDNLWSQSYYFRHYQVEQGLSHNSVTSILQDKQGFLWFGTKDGLNRFDGYSFKVFRSDSEDSGSIGSNFILKLFENQGKLWVGTDKGLYLYDEKVEKFSLLNATANKYIRDINQDKQGNLWFISDFTLYQYNEREKSLQSYDSDKFFPATSISNSTDGGLWISTSNGYLKKYDSAHDSFISFNLFDRSKKAASNWIEKIYCTGQQSILVGTQSQGFKLFDINKGNYKDILSLDPDKSDLFVRDFVKRTNDEFWIATESGIYIYNLKKGSFHNLKKNYNDPYAISDNAIYAVYKDMEEGIWVGTYFGGLNYYPKQYTSFAKFFPKIGENSISGNAVREICQDQYGNFWIGTEDAGLNKFNPKTNVFTNFKPTGEKGSLSHYNIHGLLASGNELWIGTFHQGLDVMDIRSGEIIRHYSAGSESGSLKNDFIYSLIQIHSGKILVATSSGLYQYKPKSDNFTALTVFPELNHYTTMMEDYRGTIWAGTYIDGIYYFNPGTNEKGYFRYEPENEKSLSNNAVNGIFEDHKKNLWITTSDGLCKFNPKEKNFKRYSTKDGLPSNVLYRILEDEDNNLWISTSRGLVCFDPSSEKIKFFTKAHGLLSDQFNYSSAYKDPTGRMYFGSVKGLISFHPSESIKNTFIPPIYITGFQVHNKELPVNKEASPLKQSIIYTDKITLPHNQSSFSLDFAALSFTAPEMTEFTYKMDGLDNDWTYLQTNRKVFFTELAPGEYTFLVKAANSSGLWNDKATQLKIEILPPFWATSWAYLFYTVLGALMVFLSVHNYHHKTEKRNLRKITLLENEKEKEIYQAKIEFFTNVAHEIRTPLTLIKGPLEKVIQSTPEIPGIKESLKIMEKNTLRLLNLTNQLLDFRKTETKGFSLNFVKVDIAELLQDIYLRFKPSAEQKNLSFRIELPEAHLIAYVDREALIKILSNLFSNAFKYSESRIQVKLVPPKANDKNFKVEIRNDGHLIPLEMKEKIFEPFFRLTETDKLPGTGIGLPLSRSLAELHKGYLELKPSESGMNVFVLSLPIHQENEFNLFDESSMENIEETTHAEERPEGEKPAILLIEDNKEMLDFISGELVTEYRVYKAPNGDKALEILKNQTIQLVVSDVMMTGMDGFELCKNIKSKLDFSHTPVILLTAKNSLQAKIEGLESGADAYMEKPFSTEHLKVQIANLLTNRNKIKHFFSSSPLAHIKSIAYSKADERFLEELNEAIQKNISDTDLNVEHLADIMNISRPTLYRKIKAISDLTPNELINLARLKKAAELLCNGGYRIYEIASMVGYNSQTSFGRNFLKQFGLTPSEYSNSKGSILHK